MKNINQKTKTTIGVVGDSQIYMQTLSSPSLASGVYRMRWARGPGGEMVPSFIPLEMSNDAPLIIDPGVEDIVKELEFFFTRAPVFKKMGFSHKRGYMFHGLPGCGKSCTVRLLEQRFVEAFDGIVLFWNGGIGVAEWVDEIRKHEGQDRPIMLVCEDIDSLMRDFEEYILEFLDGQKGLNNFVIVTTTNNLDAVPSRIKDRPSRIDRVIEIPKPSLEVRRAYLLGLGIEEKVAADLAKRTQGLSIAHLKEIVIATVCLKQPLSPVLERLKVADMTPMDVRLKDDAIDEPY